MCTGCQQVSLQPAFLLHKVRQPCSACAVHVQCMCINNNTLAQLCFPSFECVIHMQCMRTATCLQVIQEVAGEVNHAIEDLQRDLDIQVCAYVPPAWAARTTYLIFKEATIKPTIKEHFQQSKTHSQQISRYNTAAEAVPQLRPKEKEKRKKRKQRPEAVLQLRPKKRRIPPAFTFRKRGHLESKGPPA